MSSNIYKSVIILLLALALGFSFNWFFSTSRDSFQSYRAVSNKDLAEFFYSGEKSQAGLKEKFSSDGYNPVKILIVPGHTEEYPGSEYKTIRELDFNNKVAEKLFHKLNENNKLEVYVSNDKEIENYLNEDNNTEAFRLGYQRLHRFFSGESKDSIINNSIHSNTPTKIIERLYGINQWANENEIDIVIHIHFNSENGRELYEKGKYKGFAIYTPKTSYSNGLVSGQLAVSLYKSLSTILEPSNFEVEIGKVIESDSLIALGAFNTSDAAAVLIEYGFIYEDQFVFRADSFDKVADKTAKGILEFLK